MFKLKVSFIYFILPELRNVTSACPSDYSGDSSEACSSVFGTETWYSRFMEIFGGVLLLCCTIREK